MILQIIFQFGEVTNQSAPKSFWDYFFLILPSLLGICTLLIAYKVFKNQDAKKLFVKYQIELVLKIAENLEKTILMFISQTNMHNSSVNGFHVSSINVILSNKEKEEHKSIFGKRLLVKNNFWDIELFSVTDNLFLPKRIRDEILKFKLSTKFSFETYTHEQLQDMTDIVIVTAKDQKNLEDEQSSSVVNISAHLINNPYFKNTESFLKATLKLKKLIIDWLKDYGINANVEEI